MRVESYGKSALVISNGEIRDYSFYKDIVSSADLIICADGGARHLEGLGVMPHILLGDMDSIDSHDLEQLKEKGVKIVRYPSEKDYSDTHIAARIIAGEEEVSAAVFIGCTGSRLDHTLANISLLVYLLRNGIDAWIINENNRITVIDSSISIKAETGYMLSLLAITPVVRGVTLKGLYYPLHNAELFFDNPIGVSNEFVEEDAHVSITDGLLLVMLSKD